MGSGDAGTARQLVLAWTVATVCISVAAAARVPAVRSRPATTLAPTVGALVVLAVAVSVALLVARGLAVAPGEDVASALGIAALLAVVAALLAGARIGRLVRDLVHLAQSRHEALTDDLTGVANRRALVTHLTDRLARGRATTLLVVDLDRFTSINDRYGHTAGDALLRFVADRLVGAVAGDGIVARLGGDEFAVVLDTSPTDPRLMGERLAVVAGSTLEIDGRRVRANASVGVAQAPEHDQVDPDELLRRADAALSRAKARGSGTDLYDEEIDRAVHERARRTDELRRVLAPFGLRGHALVVHYQPQIDLRDDTVRGVEALVRWQHPGHGLLSPAQFIDLAEQDGLMGPLTSEVLRQAARDAVQWRAVGVTLRVSVNISASFLADPDLLPLVDDVLETTGLPPADLVLEVTESTLMDDPERGLQAARAIRSRGVGLSIDDYGTGYSSLSYLRDLPATELKLDRSFTRRLLDDDRTRAIVTATADLAHRLELRLIAEGVEDEQTLAAVRELGCDEVQGFVHSRPRPAGEVLGWVQAREGTPAARSDGIGWAL
nr:bifunctional diguanylate cyclase/phosphodiesterase [Cellulomonas sp. APG4]